MSMTAFVKYEQEILRLKDEIGELKAQLKEAREVIEKFITKSNGLSFYFREHSQQSDLLKAGKLDLLNRLDDLYEYSCENETLIRKKTK